MIEANDPLKKEMYKKIHIQEGLATWSHGIRNYFTSLRIRPKTSSNPNVCQWHENKWHDFVRS